MSKIPVSIMKKMISGGNYRFMVEGNSMKPAIRNGEEAWIVPAETIEINDVVLFDAGNCYMLHRVLEVLGNIIITKGDNNSCTDYPISREQVLGKTKMNDCCIFQEQKRNLMFNFWNTNAYEQCKTYGKIFSVEIFLKPGVFWEEAYNIAISPYSMESIREYRPMEDGKNTVIHIGAKISDFPCEGFILKENFDKVCRSGTFMAGHFLSETEKFLVLCGEVL